MKIFQLALPQGKVTEGRPANSPKRLIGGFIMYYIGIDVSKKDLSVFDGKDDLKFINQEGLTSFKKYLKKPQSQAKFQSKSRTFFHS